MGQVCKKCNKTNDKAQLERDMMANRASNENQDLLPNHQSQQRQDAFLNPDSNPNNGGGLGLRASYDIDLAVNPQGYGSGNDRSNYSVPEEEPITYINKGPTVPYANPKISSQYLRNPEENALLNNPLGFHNIPEPDPRDVREMYGDTPINFNNRMPDIDDEYVEYNQLELPKYIEPTRPIDTGLKSQPSNAEENINFSIGRLQKRSNLALATRGNQEKWLQVVQISQWPFHTQDDERYYPVVKFGSKREEALIRTIQAELFSDQMDSKAYRRDGRAQDMTISVTVELPGNDSVKYFKGLEELTRNLDKLNPYFIVASTFSERGACKVYCNRVQVFSISKPEELQGTQVIESIKKALSKM